MDLKIEKELDKIIHQQNMNYIHSDEIYYEISMTNYQLYKENNEKFIKISKNVLWDISDPKSMESIFEFIMAFRFKQKAAIIAVVFQALAIEAYINYYGVVKIGKEKFDELFENKNKGYASTKRKYRDIYKLIYKKSLPESEKAYQNMCNLFELRDKLVHSKTQKIDYKTGDLKKFNNSMYELLFQKDFEDIDNIIETYEQIRGFMDIK